MELTGGRILLFTTFLVMMGTVGCLTIVDEPRVLMVRAPWTDGKGCRHDDWSHLRRCESVKSLTVESSTVELSMSVIPMIVQSYPNLEELHLSCSDTEAGHSVELDWSGLLSLERLHALHLSVDGAILGLDQLLQDPRFDELDISVNHSEIRYDLLPAVIQPEEVPRFDPSFRSFKAPEGCAVTIIEDDDPSARIRYTKCISLDNENDQPAELVSLPESCTSLVLTGTFDLSGLAVATNVDDLSWDVSGADGASRLSAITCRRFPSLHHLSVSIESKREIEFDVAPLSELNTNVFYQLTFRNVIPRGLDTIWRKQDLVGFMCRIVR